MHRKHIRATVGTADADIPTGTFIANRFLYYNGIAIITVAALQGPVSSTDNAVTRWDGTTGTLVQNSTVLIDDAGAVTGVTTLNTRDPARWVDGPAAGGSTDNAIARWDGTTGRLIQNSVVVIDDTGAVTGITSIDGVPVSDFVRGPTPAVAVDDHIATWDATSGRLIQDSGLHIGDVVYNFDAEAITNNLPKFQNSTGRRLTDSGIPAANVVQSPSTSTDNAVARYDGTTGKFIQNSVVIISDAGAVTGVTTLNGIDPSTWVVGPGSSNNKRIPYFSGTSGKLLAQANYTYDGVVTTTLGDGLVANRIPIYTGIQNLNGTIIQDSGVTFDDLTFHVGTSAADRLVKFTNPSHQIADSGIDYYRVVVGTGAGSDGSAVAFTTLGATNFRITDAGYNAADVVRSSSTSTDNRVARWDGTTGRIIQTSVVTIDDSGNVTGLGTLNTRTIANWVDGPAGATNNGVVAFNGTTGKLVLDTGVLYTDLVKGPASATDNAVARFDLTSGKFIQGSSVIIDDSNNITGVGTLNTRTIANWVDGPASATDNAVARFDATTGKLVQNSVVTIGDTGAVAGVTTINSVDITAHAARHVNGGADSLFDASALPGRAAYFNSPGASISGREMSGYATRANASVSTTDEVIVAIQVQAAGDYLLRVSCPYALADTSGNIVVSALFGGTGMVSVAIGQGQGRITASGGTVSVATSTAPPTGVIFIDFLCTGLAALDPLYALVRKSTGTAMGIYKGTAILMTALASP